MKDDLVEIYRYAVILAWAEGIFCVLMASVESINVDDCWVGAQSWSYEDALEI